MIPFENSKRKQICVDKQGTASKHIIKILNSKNI